MGIWHLLEADACKHKETGKSAPLSRLIIACLEGDKIVRAMSKVLHDDDEQGPAVRDLQRGGRAVLAAGRVTGSRTAPTSAPRRTQGGLGSVLESCTMIRAAMIYIGPRSRTLSPGNRDTWIALEGQRAG